MKFVREHCSICEKNVVMPVVQEDETRPGLMWVQCPRCREIKPLEESAANEAEPPPDEGPPEQASPAPDPGRVVRNYRAGERFSTGEWIYHHEWDDTGQVVEKCRSQGGNDIIVVNFQKVGAKKLVINFAK